MDETFPAVYPIPQTNGIAAEHLGLRGRKPGHPTAQRCLSAIPSHSSPDQEIELFAAARLSSPLSFNATRDKGKKFLELARIRLAFSLPGAGRRYAVHSACRLLIG